MALERLFTPLRLGPVELPNRIVSTAHQTTLVRDHLPTDDFVAYHEARARGGAGLIVLEATAVHESGRLTPHTLAGYVEEIVPSYRRVLDAVRPHGTKLFVQLFHGGRELIASAPRPAAIAPSAVPTQRFKVEPRALREAEIEGIIAGYARSAELALEAGLDGVEISAAHNYLVAQFFTPELNRRDDRWREGKRFLYEVVAAVRRAVGHEMAVGVRLSADSEAAQRVASLLVDEDVDFLSVTLGESSTYRGSTGIVPPPPVVENAIAERARAFRLGKPLIATGRVIDPVEAERLIEEGVADAVGMTRALITDPDMPRKAREERLGEILRCIGCNACIAHYHAGTPIVCAQNPRTGRERTLPAPAVAGERKKVVVVGAGPAGLAAAAEAGAAGHEVIVLEQAIRTCGQVALAGSAPAHVELLRSLRENYQRLLHRGGVDLRLNTKATPESVARLEPDLVVVATGARPYEPPLTFEDVEVEQAWRILDGVVPREKRVVVADWGGDPAGLDAAEILDQSGNAVTLVVASAAAGEGVHQYARNLYLARLYRAGVRIEHHLELVEGGAATATFRNIFAPEVERTFPADVLVLAMGRVPNDELAEELRAAGLRVEEAGDCRSPRGIEEAILEGTLAVRGLAG